MLFSSNGGMLILLVLCHFFLTSCLSSPSNGNRKKSGGVSNSPSSVAAGYGRILADNPIILSGNYNLSADTNLNTLLSSSQDFITNNQFLADECDGSTTSIPNCIDVRTNSTSLPLQAADKKWAFQTDTDEWLQVQTFGHMMKASDSFHSTLQNAHSSAPILGYETSLPTSLFTNSTHWNTAAPLVAFANCGIVDQAFYSPSKFQLCFGNDSVFPQVMIAEDNTVIYHEMGHAFNHILMNVRNRDAGITPAADLGQLFYDEAGSINEGIADLWSYFMNQRAHFAEWALGRFANLSRPMSEDDPLHAPGIAADNNSRLSYPAYLLYDPNFPDEPIEDVHIAGQIISHFLVALGKDMSTQCGWSTSTSISTLQYLLYETFVELGDLEAYGSNADKLGGINSVNLSQSHALTWSRVANPINFRRFAQVLSKYVLLIYGQPGRTSCNSTNYDMDSYEQLLDAYGLLLFKNYNEDGGSVAAGRSLSNTEITPANKVKTVTVSKDLLKLDPTQNASQAFIFDNREALVQAYKSLSINGGIGQLSDLIDDSLPYNNGNISISPGEFVGVALNLYNDSNSPMAGIQVLGNDWDHGNSEGKPCGTFEDQFPSSSEGGVVASDEVGVPTPGQCQYITRDNGDDSPLEIMQPVCMVQVAEDNATKWAFQGALQEQRRIEDRNCLDGVGGNANECFVRVVQGTDQATYSKLDPKSNWSDTVAPNGSPTFNYSNLIFMEVSPSTPPGTTFNCRFRVRFTNCEDCWVDPAASNTKGDDYQDYQYSGGDPFKIINFEFIVID
ncbi:MAG: hypothetical protein ACJAT2_000844 [Bacteriovoracaceae bacterium]|jgi:hypothetical protein